MESESTDTNRGGQVVLPWNNKPGLDAFRFFLNPKLCTTSTVSPVQDCYYYYTVLSVDGLYTYHCVTDWMYCTLYCRTSVMSRLHYYTDSWTCKVYISPLDVKLLRRWRFKCELHFWVTVDIYACLRVSVAPSLKPRLWNFVFPEPTLVNAPQPRRFRWRMASSVCRASRIPPGRTSGSLARR